MGATTIERPTADAMTKLSDTELRELMAADDTADDARELAADELRKRTDKAGKGKASTNGADPDPEPETPAAPEVPELEIEGPAQLTMFDIGGKLPTRATLKLTGGKVKLVNGQAFKKGERVKLTVEAIVNSIEQKDEHDPKTGQVVDCEQRHGARIVDMQLESVG